jgi:hypothetical protein
MSMAEDPAPRDPNRSEGDMVRARQRGRSVVMAIGLAVLVILMFAITIAKMALKP